MAGRLYQFVKPSGAGHVCGQWVVIKYQFRDVDHTAAKNGRDDATNAATSAANSTRSASCNAAHATQPVTEQPVQMENGRIVYNRQYGNIPKGSYTGGSTYTVKKGDTLFTSPGLPGTISAIWPRETVFLPRIA